MQILSRYELFIFDWDNTLTTSTLLVALLQRINRKSGMRSVQNRKEVRVSAKEVKNVKMQEEVSRLYSTLDDAYSLVFKPKLKNDAASLLGLLKKSRKKVAVFSDSKTYRLRSETGKLGVLRYVDFALSAEAIRYYKPNPMGLLVLLDRFRVPKSRSLYVGDMATDVLTARLAGIDSCGVADGLDSFEALKDANPTYVFTNIGAFLQALRQGK